MGWVVVVSRGVPDGFNPGNNEIRDKEDLGGGGRGGG